MSYRNSRVYTAPVPKMPPGLVELIEGLAKEVLKTNPTNVYEYCADHMQKLLQLRDAKSSVAVMSLDEKISKAQQIIRERAKQRQIQYDKMVAEEESFFFYKQDATNVNDLQSSHYLPHNIVKIPFEELSVNQIELTNSTAAGTEINVDKDFTDINTDNQSQTTEVETNLHPEDNEISVQNHDSLNIDTKHTLDDVNIDTASDEASVSNQKTECIENQQILEVEQIQLNQETEENNLGSSENAQTYIDIIDIPENIQTINLNVLVTTSNNHFDNENISLAEKEDETSTEPILPSENEEPLIIAMNACDEYVAVVKNTENEKDIFINIDSLEKNDDESEDTIDIETKELTDDDQSNVMDLETAAITIQKVFRTFLFKRKTTSLDDATNVDINLFINEASVKDDSVSNMNKDRRGISRMDTVLQTVNEEKSLSLSTDDSSTLSSAATVIQAHIRGFLVRNKLNHNKIHSSASPVDSDGFSGTSLEADSEQVKGKTVLNIHIVPDRGHYTNRDESMITSMELSLDSSPPTSINLHPSSCDLSERRKQLKREDAVQSVTPPSNNSSKLSEDVDSIREVNINNTVEPMKISDCESLSLNEGRQIASNEIVTAVEIEGTESTAEHFEAHVTKMESDEKDDMSIEDTTKSSENRGTLSHSSEFHDGVLPTLVSRSDSSVARGE